MSTWVIGDVQGCWRTLQRLLDAVSFDSARDRLWFVGDLVNRGPHSLDVLRFCLAHAASVSTVLGNHDLHLLARAAGVRHRTRRDTLEEVLAAPDRDALLGWLRAQPVVAREGNHLLVHAGLDPRWTAADACRIGAEIAEHLRLGDEPLLFARPGEPLRWSLDEDAPRRRQLALTTLVATRLVDPSCALLLGPKGPPEEGPAGAQPWYDAAPRAWLGEATVVFGHWASLGHRVGDGWISLDSGCVWGRSLTALRLEDHRVVQVPSLDR